jgi:magnesium chelatase family protein
VEYKTLSSNEVTESSESIRQRVEKARAIQRERFAKERGNLPNSSMTPRLIRKHCELDSEGAGFLEQAMPEQNFSARAHDRILKVARTLAELEGSERITGNHVLEAINYRTGPGDVELAPRQEPTHKRKLFGHTLNRSMMMTFCREST